MKVMKEQSRKNKFDELEKEINALKERVREIEGYFKGRRAEEKPKPSFM